MALQAIPASLAIPARLWLLTIFVFTPSKKTPPPWRSTSRWALKRAASICWCIIEAFFQCSSDKNAAILLKKAAFFAIIYAYVHAEFRVQKYRFAQKFPGDNTFHRLFHRRFGYGQRGF
ncbi:MAG: hypothetical protein IJL24_08445 [Treponema sp.]|nr:hypothetical protein [Treponema sp.]